MQHFGLIDAGLDMTFNALFDQILLGNITVVDFLAIPSARASILLLAVVDEVQRGVTTQLGDQVQVTLPNHLQGLVVAKVSVQGQITD